MLGRKVFAPKLLYRFSLEAQVPEDHLLRRVAAAVDFAFVRRLTARFYSHTGRPGLDPVVLFKLSLLGYLYGITSERRLAEEVAAAPGLPVVPGLRPGRGDAGPLGAVQGPGAVRAAGLPGFFAEIVRQCARAGLVRGDVLYVDSTLVEANASLRVGRGAGPARPAPERRRLRRGGLAARTPSPPPRAPPGADRRRAAPAGAERAGRGAPAAARRRARRTCRPAARGR